MAAQRYGTVHARFWTSPTVAGWSDREKLAALYLLTGPHSTIAGAMRLPLAYMAADLGWPLDDCRRTVARLSRDGFVTYDEGSFWALVNRRLTYDPPDNPAAYKGVLRTLDEMPAEHPGWPKIREILQGLSERFDVPLPWSDDRLETVRGTVSGPSPDTRLHPQPKPEPIDSESNSESSSSLTSRARAPDAPEPAAAPETTTTGDLETVDIWGILTPSRDDVADLLGINGGALDEQMEAWAQLIGPRELNAILVDAKARAPRSPRAYVARCVRERAAEIRTAETHGRANGEDRAPPPLPRPPLPDAALAALDRMPSEKRVPLLVLLGGASVRDGKLYPGHPASGEALGRNWRSELAAMGLALAPMIEWPAVTAAKKSP